MDPDAFYCPFHIKLTFSYCLMGYRSMIMTEEDVYELKTQNVSCMHEFDFQSLVFSC